MQKKIKMVIRNDRTIERGNYSLSLFMYIYKVSDNHLMNSDVEISPILHLINFSIPYIFNLNLLSLLKYIIIFVKNNE